jgi:hypothetical protein
MDARAPRHGLAGHLGEVAALPDQLPIIEIAGPHPLRMVGEEAGHHPHRVSRHERPAALGKDVRPQHQGQQRLFRGIKEMPEEIMSRSKIGFGR